MAEHDSPQSDLEAERLRIERLRVEQMREEAVNRALAEAREETERKMDRGHARKFRRQALAEGWKGGGVERAGLVAMIVMGLGFGLAALFLLWELYSVLREYFGAGR